MSDRRQGDFGQTLTINVAGIDVTTMDTKEISVLLPDRTVTAWSVDAFGTDTVTHLFQDGELALPGIYRGHVVMTRVVPAEKFTTTPFFISVEKTP